MSNLYSILLRITAAASLIAVPSAWADHDPHGGVAAHALNAHAFSDYGEVVDVEPRVRMVEIATPREECWEEAVRYVHGGRDYATADSVVGGIVGGLLGREIGGGRGRDAAIIGGTLIGAVAGRSHGEARSRPSQEHVHYETRCRTVQEYHSEERIGGYRVTYVYRGETFTTQLPYDPGDRLPLQVRVSPARR